MTDKPTSILDPRFKYTSAAKTNLKRRFAQIRRELKEQAEAAALAEQATRKRRTSERNAV